MEAANVSTTLRKQMVYFGSKGFRKSLILFSKSPLIFFPPWIWKGVGCCEWLKKSLGACMRHRDVIDNLPTFFKFSWKGIKYKHRQVGFKAPLSFAEVVLGEVKGDSNFHWGGRPKLGVKYLRQTVSYLIPSCENQRSLRSIIQVVKLNVTES